MTVFLESKQSGNVYILSVLKCFISFEQIILLWDFILEAKARNMDNLYMKMFTTVIFITKKVEKELNKIFTKDGKI